MAVVGRWVPQSRLHPACCPSMTVRRLQISGLSGELLQHEGSKLGVAHDTSDYAGIGKQGRRC